MKQNILSFVVIEPLVRQALAEDLGRAGDITTNNLPVNDIAAHGNIVARKDGRIAGLDIVQAVFRFLDDSAVFEIKKHDGSDVSKGDVIMSVKCKASALLTGERTALNFLGHLSGIATETQKFVKAISGHKTKIICTRKTTPCLRAVEKHAVRMGGGFNHRFGLDDAVMIKDNHIAISKNIKTAVESIYNAVGHTVKIEVEVDTLDQLHEVLKLENMVDIVLLDNMPPADLAKAVKLIDGKIITEASGAITLEKIKDIASTGVDYISIGRITHSAPSLDIALDFI